MVLLVTIFAAALVMGLKELWGREKWAIRGTTIEESVGIGRA